MIRSARVVLVLAVFSGAAHAAPGKRVTLEIEATTWRENRKPRDIRPAITQKLAAAGVTVVKGGPADGKISIVWTEAEGDTFTEVGNPDGPQRTGTDLTFDLSMVVGEDEKELLTLHAEAGPGEFVQGDLYPAALEAIQNNDQYEFAGHLVAAALGMNASLPKLLPMLCGEEAETAKQLLDAASYTGKTPAEEASFALAAGDYGRLVEIGKPAVAPMLECARKLDPLYPMIDTDIAETLGKIGDPRATSWLLEELSEDSFLSMIDSREMDYQDDDVPSDVILVIGALGDAGDGRALATLDGLASRRKKFPTLAAAAKEAASNIRIRAKGGKPVKKPPIVCTDATLGIELELPQGWSFVPTEGKVCAFSDGASASGEVTVTEGADVKAHAEQVQASLGESAKRSADIVTKDHVVRSFKVGDVKIAVGLQKVASGIATVIVADRGSRSLPEIEKVAKGLHRSP